MFQFYIFFHVMFSSPFVCLYLSEKWLAAFLMDLGGENCQCSRAVADITLP